MPDSLVKIDNPDKKLHCLDSRYGELGFSFPALILIVGKRGSSKTTCALNILGKSRYAGKPFDRIVIWHGDPSGTEEYRILTDDGASIVGELPPMDSFDNTKRNVLVVDEVNFLAFNSSSLDIMVYTFTKTTQWVRFHEVKEDVLLKISDIFCRSLAHEPLRGLQVPEAQL